MIKFLVVLVSVLSLTSLTVPAAEEVNVTGKWSLTMTTPRGERTQEVEFVQAGEELTVVSSDRDGNRVESKGTVKGDAITWSQSRQSPSGETMTITYAGTVEGDAMQGTVTFGDFGGGEWSATRVQEPESK
jgi:hypothetical protein